MTGAARATAATGAAPSIGSEALQRCSMAEHGFGADATSVPLVKSGRWSCSTAAAAPRAGGSTMHGEVLRQAIITATVLLPCGP